MTRVCPVKAVHLSRQTDCAFFRWLKSQRLRYVFPGGGFPIENADDFARALTYYQFDEDRDEMIQWESDERRLPELVSELASELDGLIPHPLPIPVRPPYASVLRCQLKRRVSVWYSRFGPLTDLLLRIALSREDAAVLNDLPDEARVAANTARRLLAPVLEAAPKLDFWLLTRWDSPRGNELFRLTARALVKVCRKEIGMRSLGEDTLDRRRRRLGLPKPNRIEECCSLCTETNGRRCIGD